MSSVTSQIVTQTVNQTLAVTSTTSNIPTTVTATVTSNGGIFPSNIDFGSGGSELLVGNAENQSGLGTQLVICVSAGAIFFLSFCLLRTRLPVIFAPRANMKRFAFFFLLN
jgi:hypothetical protein